LSVAAPLAHSERALLVSCLGRAVDTFFRSNKLLKPKRIVGRRQVHVSKWIILPVLHSFNLICMTLGY